MSRTWPALAVSVICSALRMSSARFSIDDVYSFSLSSAERPGVLNCEKPDGTKTHPSRIATMTDTLVFMVFPFYSVHLGMSIPHLKASCGSDLRTCTHAESRLALESGHFTGAFGLPLSATLSRRSQW